MAKKQKKSAVIELLDLVYANAMKAEPRSWQRINYAMCRSLEMAIGALFTFNPDDFTHIFSNYNSGYWLTYDPERWYSQAVASGNTSAWESFERKKGRQPLIADNVTPVESRYAHRTGIRLKERLHVGAEITWKGLRVKVTSFNADGSCTACAYDGRGHYGSKVVKRFRITRDDIIQERADAKRRNEISVEAVSWTESQQKTFLSILGNPKECEFAVLPLKKIEAARTKALK